jgi:hypothetical protein
VEQLGAMTFEQVVDAISSWRPGRSQFTGPSITGLESAFEHYVATRPEAFSKQARTLIDRPAIFLRGFLHQISESIKAERQIDLSAVLDLCDWL